MFHRVAIVGLGLIGGSIGLALQKAKAAREIVGYDFGKGVSQRARKMGAISQVGATLLETVRGAELVILATPVGAMHQLLQSIGPALSPGAVVTDVASTKMQVIKWAQEHLPDSVSFVGGHPMAGKELSGIEAADATLFKSCIYCLTPTVNTRPDAVDTVNTLIEVLGARARFLEPAEHDGQVAGVSHLPFVASIALVQALSEDGAWPDASLLAANGFRDMSRLAAGSPEMYRDICLTNSTEIARWLDAYITNLQALRVGIADHDNALGDIFARARQQRQQWQASSDLSE